ncbi:MAG: UDP-D-galactose:(glucosyl)lipopolysaccharide-1,6-D-galactosyltransferase [Methanomethylovorans sp. PtaU1.Bin093]|mgnify:FL=1|uniref:glycosyltransferase family 4 protein n=1 Tax=Methanomethylovorans sp. PtaU1.Bin093 TaxID=1811679 RepID=UPI0009CB2C5C|nr:glycosyltransferase family 4 protein [Methanomethylovorans sp. PtaU1.Bin093]OPY20352.1 MAG: UDP-D-galactose:(glucosyl)lipopolysaccharide-1,6-D-galactosyltransferase [Methanomethylovorans sp. PtaU1.Bin093]
MRIAFVYDAVYPWVKGGAEKRIYELGIRFIAKGHEVHLFGIKWWEGADVIEHDGMFLHGVCKSRELYVEGRRSISAALVYSIKLFSHLRREKFDLIDVSVFPYFSCFTVRLVSILNKGHVVYTWHEVWGDYWYYYMGKAGFFGKMIEKAVSKISGNNIAVSEWTKQRLEELGVSEEKISVIPNGIDLQAISEIQAEGGNLPEGIDEKFYDVIFAGRLIKDKNVDFLLRAVSLLKIDYPGLICCIVGDGPEKTELVDLSNRIGIYTNVEFVGFQDYSSLIGKIKASKVFVLPSSREGFGMVVIEAFACGIPVITVKEKYNAAQGLVEDGLDGFVVALDEREIAQAVGKIIEDAQCRKNMSKAAFQKSEGYDWNEALSKFEKYL